LACLTMEGPARRNSGKLSSNQPVFRFSRKRRRRKRFQANVDAGLRQETASKQEFRPRSDFIGTE
jgi:hypothetical protein